MNDIYITKYDREENFNKHTLVNVITTTYSGNCYLVEGVENKIRHWIMRYDLYPLDKINLTIDDYKNEELEKIGMRLFNAIK